MKKLLLLSILAVGILTACTKEEDVPQGPLPEAQTQGLINTGACEHIVDWAYTSSGYKPVYCNLRTCRNPTHELCNACGISRRVGCICTSGAGTGGSDPGQGTQTGTFRITPSQIFLTDSKTVNIFWEVWSGAGWLAYPIPNIYTIEGSANLYRIENWGDHMKVSLKQPGTSGEAYINFYHQQDLEGPLVLIQRVTISS